MLSGLSGLRAAQTGIAVASQNISNASTPGYVRAELSLQAGVSGGVDVASVQRAADRFLAHASQLAEAAKGAASVRSELLDRAQASFGDPSGGPSMFTSLDDFWSALTELGIDPSSSIRRGDAVSALQATFGEVRRVADMVQSLTAEADQRIADKVSEAQDLMNQIVALNKEISLNKRAGSDVTGAENAQSALIDKLATLIDIRVTAQPEGGVQIRTSGGALLVGVDAAQISYTPTGSAFGAHGFITLNPQLGTQTNIEPFLTGGEIRGLLDARDIDLAGLAETLGGMAGALADTLNQVHNENVATPAPSQLTGRQTGLLATDALNFTGRSVVGIVDSTGAMRQRLTVDFDTQTITGESPAATYSFAGGTIGSFVSALNTALGAATPSGSASFVNGVLSMNVGAGGGVAIQQDGTTPSDRAGRGFPHFFGLNDLVSRPTPLFFETGASGTDLNGLNVGGALSYEVRDSAGRFIANRTINITGALAAGTWNGLLGALNAAGTGVGEYASFALDPTTGRVQMTSGAGFSVTLTGDSTTRGGTGVSFSALNGMTAAATAGRAVEVDVSSRIAGNPSLLAVGRADMGVALGQRAIEGGDSRGAAALAAARTSVIAFPGAGTITAHATSLASLISKVGGEAGRLAANAQRISAGAETVANAATDRRSQIEGVNLDDELLRMTAYQNAYAASARVIQAATEMLDVLLAIGLRQ